MTSFPGHVRQFIDYFRNCPLGPHGPTEARENGRHCLNDFKFGHHNTEIESSHHQRYGRNISNNDHHCAATYRGDMRYTWLCDLGSSSPAPLCIKAMPMPFFWGRVALICTILVQRKEHQNPEQGWTKGKPNPTFFIDI